MKKILALILNVFAIHVIQTIVVLNEGAWLFKVGTLTEVDKTVEDNDVLRLYHFEREVTKETDISISYYAFDLSNYESIINGTTMFCEADVSTLEGSVSAIAARCLGLYAINGSPCPIEKGKYVGQYKVFTMDNLNVDRFFENGVTSVELVMGAHDEDWGVVCYLLTDEVGAEYIASLD